MFFINIFKKIKFVKRLKKYGGVLLLFFFLRLPLLGADIANTDSIRWHLRSQNFRDALININLENTYQHYQPGVTIMWIETFTRQLLNYILPDVTSNIFLHGNFEIYHGIIKFSILLVLALILMFLMACIEDLFDEKVSQFFGLFMATEIYLAGIDRWVHLTSLETYFSFASFISILVWTKRQSKNWIKLSGIFLGLAVLSKLTALIVLLPILFLIFYRNDGWFKNATLFITVFCSIIVILFPAIWVNPIEVFSKLYFAIFNAVSNDVRSQILASHISPIFYFVVLAYKLSPITFSLGIISIILLPFSLKQKYLKYIFIYFFTYMLLLSLSEKKIDRYVIAVFPPLLLLISFYISKIGNVLQKVVYLLILIITIWGFSKYNPVYSAYYSPVFGGAKKALNIGVFENSGEYFRQAADYLNSKSGTFTVTVPNNIDTFKYFYKGESIYEFTPNTHYVVWSLDIDRRNLPKYEQCPYLEKTFGTNDFSYVYLFKCEQKF